MFQLLPLYLAIGISLVFYPENYLYIICVVIFVTLILGCSYYHIVFMIISVVLGISAANLRIHNTDTQFIDEEIEVRLKGEISGIILDDKGAKLLINNIRYTDNLGVVGVLNSVRLHTRSYEHLHVGDTIITRAHLLPPSSPLTPNGFDFRFYSFFQGIQAVGYTTSKAKVLEQKENWRHINHWRAKANAIITEQADSRVAPIIKGMLLGDSKEINRNDYQAIRVAGLAHIIAISGMHIVVVVSIVFGGAWYLLRFSSYLCLYYNIRKIAACLAIPACYLYLLLAGNPISGQRALIVSTLVLLGIIIDLQITPMRALHIAAISLLIMQPESLFMAGAQMSFAACYALVASFSYTYRFYNKPTIIRYLLSITMASIVAGLATYPFVLHHFHQFNTYGVFSNLLAVPLSDFVIMPLLLLALLSMPIGCSWPFLQLSGWAMQLLIKWAYFIAWLPGANIYVPPPTNLGIAVFAICLFLLCIMQNNVRQAHFRNLIILMMVLSLYWMRDKQDRPLALIHGKGDFFIIKLNAEYYISSKKRGRFIQSVWMGYLALENLSLLRKQKSECQSDVCLLPENNLAIWRDKDNLWICWQQPIMIMNKSSPYCTAPQLVKQHTFLWKDGSEVQIK